MSRQTLPALASAHHPQPLHDLHGLPPPSPWLLAMELRAPWEFGASMAAWPLLQRAPRGDGHGVIVYPGLSANDASTIPLRRFLRHLGYEVHGWEQGFNFGPRHGVLEACIEQITKDVGPVDVLVNNHTYCVLETFDPALVTDAPFPVQLVSAAQIDAHFAVNSRAFALLMAEYAAR